MGWLRRVQKKAMTLQVHVADIRSPGVVHSPLVRFKFGWFQGMTGNRNPNYHYPNILIPALMGVGVCQASGRGLGQIIFDLEYVTKS
jgi:hypothetical protein